MKKETVIKLLLQRTVDSSRGHFGQLETTFLQEGNGDLHAVISWTLEQQSEHLQTQNLVGLKASDIRAERDRKSTHPIRIWTSTLEPSVSI